MPSWDFTYSQMGGRGSILQQMCAKQLKQLRALKTRDKLEITPLLEWVPRVTPKYMPPKHLGPMIERLEATRTKAIRTVVHTPPRHGKTETLLHFIGWTLAHDPSKTLAYVSYAEDIALSKSRKAQNIARAAGVELVNSALHEWRTAQGGGLLATGVGGPLTGHGVDVMIVDDPVKNRVDADSAGQRNMKWEWFNDVAMTRIEPGGSCVVVMTRWHEDDLSGRLLKMTEVEWEDLRLPAINEQGEALWPERWGVKELEAKRAQVGEWTWAALFQGHPRPKGGTVFGEAHTYTELPKRFTQALGIDLAYSKSSSADYSVMVRMIHCEGFYYVTDVIRAQERQAEFKARVKWMKGAHKGITTRFYAAGTEKLAEEFYMADGLDIGIMPATGDKFVRSQPFAAAWNAGKVLVPEDAPWLNEYLTEIGQFTGVSDVHDDQVDASAAAFDCLAPTAPANRLRALVSAL